MTSHGQWTPGDLISVEDRNAEHDALVALLARHATSVQLIRLDAGIKAIKAGTVAEFLAQTEQLVRALRRHVELPAPPEAPADEALAGAARRALAEAGDAPRPVVQQFSVSGKGWPPPFLAEGSQR